MSPYVMYANAALLFHCIMAVTCVSLPFGSLWYKSTSRVDINASEDLLTWHPSHPDALVTYLPKASLDREGDHVIKVFNWSSSGPNTCPPADTAHGGYCANETDKCIHRSASCLAGTGDWRIGIFQAGEKVSADGFGSSDFKGMFDAFRKPPWNAYKGWHFRIFPHVSTKAEHVRAMKGRSTCVPCGIYKKTGDDLLAKGRLREFGCFGTPLGAWTNLTLSAKRLKSSVLLTMTMNGVTYSAEDDALDQAPAYIDTVAMVYPNQRGYDYVKWASVV